MKYKILFLLFLFHSSLFSQVAAFKFLNPIANKASVRSAVSVMHFSRTQTLTIANNTRDISGKAFSLIKTLIEKENIALTEKIFRNGGRVHFGNSFAYEGAVDISKISKLDFSATFDEIVGKTKAGTPVVEKKIISGSLRLIVDNPTAFNALSDVQQKNLLKNMLRENRAAGVEIVTVMDAW